MVGLGVRLAAATVMVPAPLTVFTAPAAVVKAPVRAVRPADGDTVLAVTALAKSLN